MIIQAYKSRITGEIFEDIDNYKSHHRKALIYKKYQMLYHSRREEFSNLISNFRETVCKISDIEDWIVNHSTKLAKHLDIERIDKNGKLVHYEIVKCKIDVKHTECVSNSHCAPLKGGVQNWDRADSKPTFYSGWHGKLTYSYIGNLDVFPSDIFKKIGIFAGGGGGGGQQFSCEVSLFDADWPSLIVYEILSR